MALFDRFKKFLDEGIAQVNPFDHGQTAATVAQRAQPAQTPPPGFRPPQNQPVGVLSPQRLNQLNVLSQPKVDTSLGGSLKRVGTQVGLGATRSLVGTAQGLSGLYDLATPGTSTNRLSKALNTAGQTLDTTAQNEQGNRTYLNNAYKLGQGTTDVASFFGPGAIAKGGTALAARVPQISRAATLTTDLAKPLVSAVDTGINEVSRLGPGGRIAATGLRAATNPSNITNIATGTGLDLGAQSGKGRDITGRDVALSLGANAGLGIGAPMAGSALSEAARAIDLNRNINVFRGGHPDALGTWVTQNKRLANDFIDEPGKRMLTYGTQKKNFLDPTNPDHVIAIEKSLGRDKAAKFLQQATVPETGKFNPDSELAVRNLANKLGFKGAAFDEYNLPGGTRPFGRQAISYNVTDPTALGLPVRRSIGLSTQMVDENGMPISWDDVRASRQMASEMSRPESVSGLSGRPELQASSAAPIPPATMATAPTFPDTALRNGSLAPSVTRPPVAPITETASVPPPPVIRRPAGLAQPPDVPAILNTKTGKTTRYASKTVPESEFVSGAVGEQTKANAPTYVQQTEKGRYTDALSRLKTQGEDQFHTSLMERLNAKEGSIGGQDVADAQALAAVLDAKGDTQSLQKAADIYDKVSGHLTAQGQSIQAAAILARRTPESLAYGAQRQFKKAGVEYTPELQQKIKQAIDEFRKTAPDSEARNYAVSKIQKVVTDNIPASVADKVSAIWKAGLLTGVKTQTGNFLSNATFGGLHALSNPLAAGIDRAIALKTGQRTKTLTGKGILPGIGEGIKKGGKFVKTGIDERNITSTKLNQHGEIKFKNPALNTYVNGVFRIMGAADRPAYYAQLRNSLQDLAKADGLNNKLHGKALRDHVTNFVKDPPKAAFQTAADEAEKAVLGNDTLLSKVAGRIRQVGDKQDNPLARGAANLAFNTLMPFTKVPSAFISRVIDYTPVGAVKEASLQIAKRKLDQRTLATALSEATTGTSVAYLGYQLAKNGQLSGDYPQDTKEQQRWKAEGIQPNSVKVGNKWLSLNYFGPAGSLFSQGKRIADSKSQGDSTGSQYTKAGVGIAQDALNQSFLQGVSGVMDAISDPQRSAKNYVNNQAGSYVPTILNDIATGTDPKQRETNNPLQTLQSRIPGLRQGLPVKQDVYGNELSRKTSTGSTIANPFRPSDTVSNDVKKEVARLHDKDPNNPDYQITPAPLNKNMLFNGIKTTLTDQQLHDLQKSVGQSTQQAWNDLIKSKSYQSLSDDDKAKALTSLRQDVSSAMQTKFAKENKLGQYADNFAGKKTAVPARQASILNGNLAASSYATADGKISDKLTPKDKYQQAIDDYNQNKGGMSDLERYKTENSLKRLKVAAGYDKDVVDLYGLGKSDVYQYISNNNSGASLAKKLLAYGDALVDAGIEKQNKFRNKNGNESFAPAAKKSGRKKGGLPTTAKVDYKGFNTRISSILKGSAGAKTASLPKARKIVSNKGVRA